MNPNSDIDKLEAWVNTEDKGPQWWETTHDVKFDEMRVSDVILVSAKYDGQQEYLVFVCVDFHNRCPVFSPFRVNGSDLEEINDEPSGGWGEIDSCCADCFPECDTEYDEEKGRRQAPGFSVSVIQAADEPALIAKHGITIEQLCNKALAAVDIVTDNYPRHVRPYDDDATVVG